MKQNDIILIIVAVFIGGVLSFVISRTFFGSSNRQVSVEVVEPITSEFQAPNDKYFNSSAYNPTQNIQISTGDGQVKFDQ